MKPATMPESALRKAVEAYLDIREAAGDLMWTRTDAASKDVRARGRHVRKGWPDLTIVVNGGRALAIELKTARGELRDEQRATLLGLFMLGAPIAVCRSVGEVAKAVDDALLPIRNENAREPIGVGRGQRTRTTAKRLESYAK